MNKETLYFQSSFNRPNLIYEVIPKSVDYLDKMIQLIKKRFSKQSGIIYCPTTKDCDLINRLL